MNTQTQPEERSFEDLEDEIATLSATIQAATYRLICLIGEVDRRDGWADPLDSNGFRSCAHWLAYRTNLSLGAARQHVRIARKLPELPLISEAFSKGEISYSKVRAATRIATPENEKQVLEFTRAGDATHVEKLVRRYRKANVEQEIDRAVEQQESRHLVTYFDNDGMLVVKGRLAPEQGALLLKALEVSTDELRDPQNGTAVPSPALAPETVRRLVCNASVSTMAHGPDGELIPGRKTRVVSTTLRRALRSRDGTGCVFPGCTCRGRDAHHIEHWGDGGPTVLENLVSLCRAHHTFVHEGGIRVEVLGDRGFRFVWPDETEVVTAPSVLASLDGSAEPDFGRWLSEGVQIGPMTGRPTWDGG